MAVRMAAPSRSDPSERFVVQKGYLRDIARSPLLTTVTPSRRSRAASQSSTDATLPRVVFAYSQKLNLIDDSVGEFVRQTSFVEQEIEPDNSKHEVEDHLGINFFRKFP